MKTTIQKFLKLVGFSPADKPGLNDSTVFRKTGEDEWTFTQEWDDKVDTLVLSRYRQAYTKVSLQLYGRNPDDWELLAALAFVLRRMTKTCVQQYGYCVDITWGKGEYLKLYAEMVVQEAFDENYFKPRRKHRNRKRGKRDTIQVIKYTGHSHSV